MMNKRATATVLVLVSAVAAGTYAVLGRSSPPAADAPTEIPTFAGCGYVWASKDLPEITQQADEVVKQANPVASARADAFGENCVYGDGRADFGAMETDFHVSVPVNDLKDERALGDQIAALMIALLERFPSGSLPGGQDGLVEFRFEQSDTEYVIVRVPIQKYRSEATGIRGAELFRMFSQDP
ncbi:MAG TPA: hypothetical protein VGJ22_03060 [Anaerolineales bacterium]